MRRLVWSSALVIALAACADDSPLGLDTMTPQAAATFAGAGGITFHESGCTYQPADLKFSCSYTVQNLNAERSYNMFVQGDWAVEYQCVHAKTGKTSKQHPPRTQTRTVTNVHTGITGATQHSVANELVEPPADLTALNPCVGNKGPFTSTQYGPVTSAGWLLEIEDDQEWWEYWARLFDTSGE